MSAPRSRSAVTDTGHSSGDYEVLGASVYDGGPLTVVTSRGPIVCLQEATYTQLLHQAQTPPVTPVPRSGGTSSIDADAAVAVVRLTTREVQMLASIAAGDNAAEIAERLGLATNTVAQHLVSIRRKYRVRTTAAAVLAAHAEGHL